VHANLVREQENGEDHQRDQYDERLEREGGIAAQISHHLANKPDDEQINAREQEVSELWRTECEG